MKNARREWKLMAHKSVGTSHKKLGLPCQDYCRVKTVHVNNNILSNPIIIGAISDGAGSAKWAKIASQTAVEKALLFCEKRVKLLRKIDISSPQFENYLSRYSIKLVEDILEGSNGLKHKSNSFSCSLKDFSCTLIAFIASPAFIICLQIGDGFLVTNNPSSDRYKLLFKPEKGEYANETTFITSANVYKHIKTKVAIENLSFICASTDGLERVALNLNDGTAHAPFFQPLDDLVSLSQDKEFKVSQLSSFLNSDKLNSRTDDDKSIILCCLPAAIDR